MPKSLVVSHLLLLALLSAIAFPAAAQRWSTGLDGPLPWTTAAAVVAVVLAAVMAVTEAFSGRRWPALVALAATATGLIATVTAPGAAAGIVAWGVAWLAVGSWFAGLSLRARENR